MFSSASFGSVSIFVVLLSAASSHATGSAEELAMLSTQNFAEHLEAGGNDWVVLYCDEEKAESCKHMTASLQKLNTIWKGTQRFPSTSFGEVNCANDKVLCEAEGVKAFPTAVHYKYKKHVQVSTWTPTSEKQSMVWQFVDWVKGELDAPPAADKVDKSAVNSFRLALFSEMDTETAVVGHVLILGIIMLVAWVIVEGFELWPKSLKDGQQGQHLIPW
jgi:hypothetical protein